MARYFGVPLRNGLPIGLGSTIAINRAVRQALPPPSGDALLQEDGTSYFELQDGTGYILLEGLMPTLWLDFQNSTSLDSRITFTRASNATYFNSAGVLTTAGSGVARFDYNPSTLQPRGLLIEEQRTNSIRNNTMQGAVAGTPGTAPTNWSRSASPTSGISNEIVGTGTESGITYIDLRFTGTATATIGFSINLETSSGAAASASQTWTTSTYAKLQAGSLNGSTFQFVLNEYSSVPAFLRNTFSSTVTPTTAALNTQRSTFTVTTGASTAFVQPVVSVIFTNGQTYDFTLRIGLPQLEQGAFATSVIPTTTTALTRNADVASMTGTNFSSWYNQTEGSLFGQFSLISSSYTTGVALDVGAGGAFGTTEYLSWIGTGWALAPNFAPINVNSSVAITASAKVIAGIKANDSVIAGNGLIGSVDASCAVPASATTLTIGKGGWSGSGNYINGWVQRIAYYPTRLPNATLQALTA